MLFLIISVKPNISYYSGDLNKKWFCENFSKKISNGFFKGLSPNFLPIPLFIGGIPGGWEPIHPNTGGGITSSQYYEVMVFFPYLERA